MDKRGENAGARSLGAFEVKNGGRSTGQEREITELGSIEIKYGREREQERGVYEYSVSKLRRREGAAVPGNLGVCPREEGRERGSIST